MNRRQFVVAGSLSLASVACNRPTQRSSSMPPGLAAVEAPTALPAFSLTDVEGKAVQSGDLLGNVLILRFWATW